MPSPIHPLFIHFPIALYFLGVLLTAGCIWRHNDDYERFAYWAFFLSWIAAIVASVMGLIDRGQLAFDDPRQSAINAHITPAIAFIVINGLLLYMRFRWADVLSSKRSWLYLGLMAVGLAVIAFTGFQGGELVFKLGVGVQNF